MASMPIDGGSSLNLTQFMQKMMVDLKNQSSGLQGTMDKLKNKDGEISQEKMLELQFKIGNYQSVVSTLNNTVSSVLNQTKELAKSIH